MSHDGLASSQSSETLRGTHRHAEIASRKTTLAVYRHLLDYVDLMEKLLDAVPALSLSHRRQIIKGNYIGDYLHL